MKTKEEIKKELLDNLDISIEIEDRPKGGQHCGMRIHPIVVKCEELLLEIKVKQFRSNHKNKEYALSLMEYAIDKYLDENYG